MTFEKFPNMAVPSQVEGGGSGRDINVIFSQPKGALRQRCIGKVRTRD